MECDWEIEIGTSAPVIDAAWEGYVDLCTTPGRVDKISEAAQIPSLAETLVRLNSPASVFRTVKCDVWPVEEFDPDEMDAERESATSAQACYVDLIPANAGICSTLDGVADWCRRLCLDLRTRLLRQCRVDAIVRRAFVAADIEGIGITVYVTACGSSSQEALAALSSALRALADSHLALSAADHQPSKYNQDIVGE
jgi:hypothetical protein